VRRTPELYNLRLRRYTRLSHDWGPNAYESVWTGPGRYDNPIHRVCRAESRPHALLRLTPFLGASLALACEDRWTI
jgi:hypothetical protein